MTAEQEEPGPAPEPHQPRARRARDTEDWRLHPHIVDQLREELDDFQVDLFSTNVNKHCIEHYTKENDAFDHMWVNKAFYANPPLESP